MNKPKQFPAGAKMGGISPTKAVAVIIALVLLYAVYTLLQPSALNITSTTSVSMQANQTVLVRIYGGEPMAIWLQSTSNASVDLYVTRLPVLYGPVSSVFLSPAGGANVSSNGTRIADLNIKLSSSSPSGASIVITPLPSALAIGSSPSISVLSPVSFYSQVTANVVQTTATTTVGSTSTVQTTTILAQNSTAQLLQHALSLMNGTTVGALMSHYKALYIADAGCTGSVYNSTYDIYYNAVSPPAYANYANASLFTPRDLLVNETLLPARNNVMISYSTVSPSQLSTGIALTAVINASALSYLKNVSYLGVYYHLNYSRLNTSYTEQRSLGSACGAWIPPK